MDRYVIVIFVAGLKRRELHIRFVLTYVWIETSSPWWSTNWINSEEAETANQGYLEKMWVISSQNPGMLEKGEFYIDLDLKAQGVSVDIFIS